MARPSIAAAIALCALIFTAPGAGAQNAAGGASRDLPGLTFAGSFEGGALYRTAPAPVASSGLSARTGVMSAGTNGSYNVAILKGGWREMGRQYGRLLSAELHDFWGEAVEDMLIDAGETQANLRRIASVYFDRYPERHKDFIRGMAETSGLGLERHIIMNVVDPYMEIFGDDMEAKRLACSGIGAWGSYTKDGTLYFGRNYDYAVAYKHLNRFLTVVVLDPDDAPNDVTAIHWVGTTLTQNGMNDKGLFLELDTDAITVIPAIRERTPVVTRLLDFLLVNSTIAEMDVSFASADSDFGCIIQVADENAAYSYEWPTYGMRRRSEQGREGLLVATNNAVPPIPPEWVAKGYPENPVPGDPRRTNFLALGDSYRGRIDLEAMKEIMDVDIRSGGAMHAGTVYQLIAIPKDGTIWMRAMDWSDWIEIDAAALMRH